MVRLIAVRDCFPGGSKIITDRCLKSDKVDGFWSYPNIMELLIKDIFDSGAILSWHRRRSQILGPRAKIIYFILFCVL